MAKIGTTVRTSLLAEVLRFLCLKGGAAEGSPFGERLVLSGSWRSEDRWPWYEMLPYSLSDGIMSKRKRQKSFCIPHHPALITWFSRSQKKYLNFIFTYTNYRHELKVNGGSTWSGKPEVGHTSKSREAGSHHPTFWSAKSTKEHVWWLNGQKFLNYFILEIRGQEWLKRHSQRQTELRPCADPH